MNRPPACLVLACVLATLLASCANPAPRRPSAPLLIGGMESHRHAGSDDLLTAGLGIEGLRSPVPPAFANPDMPTAAERRRRAIWTNWRGIADLSPGGGFGEVYGSARMVPGTEYHGFARIAGASQPHRVMLQVPDDFDAVKRCVIVAASSGSRGIYGAIALAGSWGLTHGCAVAYTDKGAGTDYAVSGDPPRIATRHANSRDNPEADWGRHVQQAGQFALQVLTTTRSGEPAYTEANSRVIAVGVSNGGGAVLRAAELPDRLLDGVVAVSPNIHAAGSGRALYDYASEAALYLPCALDSAAFDAVAMARPAGKRPPTGATRCASLRAAGLLRSADSGQQAEEARSFLLRRGWTDAALPAAALSNAFDLWRSVLVTYAASYSRTPADAMPCGYGFAVVDASGKPRAPTEAESAAWASDSAGIPPGAGVGITDPMAATVDPAWPGLVCLRALWSGSTAVSARLQSGVAQTRAQLPRRNLPVIVIHGASDGLIPEAFSGAPYVRWARGAGRDVRYWRVANAQHFDAFLGLPPLAASYLPMLPYAYGALDAMWAHLESGHVLTGDIDIANHPRKVGPGGVAPLRARDLGVLPE